MTFAGRAIYAIPLFFTAGFLLSDHYESSAEESRLLATRVQQRLGEWTPPPLSEEDRRLLLAEHERCSKAIAKLERRVQQTADRGLR
jgi:hypothetical protein